MLNPMIEKNHAIGNVFFETVARQRALAAFAGDDCGHAFVLEPAEEAAQLRPKHAGIGKAGEERLRSIEENAFCLDRIDGGVQADEQAFQIILTCLGDLALVDKNVVDDQLFGSLEFLEIEPERGDIHREIVSGFLETDADAGLIELRGSADQEFYAEERFPTSGA